MKYLLFVVLYLVLLPGFSKPANQSQIPLSVESVETHRVGERMLRIINYFPQVGQIPKYMELELIRTPKLDIVESRLAINKVKIQLLGKETMLDFHHSQMASIENVRVVNGVVHFNLFFASGAPPPTFNVYVACQVDANLDVLPSPICQQVPMQD